MQCSTTGKQVVGYLKKLRQRAGACRGLPNGQRIRTGGSGKALVPPFGCERSVVPFGLPHGRGRPHDRGALVDSDEAGEPLGHPAVGWSQPPLGLSHDPVEPPAMLPCVTITAAWMPWPITLLLLSVAILTTGLKIRY